MSSRGRTVAVLAVLGALGACKGNVNDDVVRIAVTSRVSIDSAGTEAPNDCDAPSISADGRLVVFQTFSALDPLDTIPVTLDVYIRDRVNKTTQLVSVNSAGTAGGNGWSFEPMISPDGRYVAFWSSASDLDAAGADVNAYYDIFVRDLVAGVTTLVSVSSASVQGNESCYSPQIAVNATDVYVAWNSSATSFVGNTDNDRGTAGLGTEDNDVFVRRMSRIDLAAGTVAGTTLLVSQTAGSASGDGPSSVVPSGRGMAVDGTSVYIVMAAAAQDLQQGGVAVTDSGRIGGGILDTDVFVTIMPLNLSGITSTTLMSVRDDGMDSGNVLSTNPAISDDASTVAFQSYASDLLPPNADTNAKGDIFVRAVGGSTTTRVSVSSSGSEGDDESNQPDLSADGRYVIFNSAASNLVSNDVNASADIFRHDRTTGATIRVSVRTFGTQADGGSDRSSVSANGKTVAFSSFASNLVGDDTNAAEDVFVRQY